MTKFNMLTLSAVLDVVAGRFVEEGEEEEKKYSEQSTVLS